MNGSATAAGNRYGHRYRKDTATYTDTDTAIYLEILFLYSSFQNVEENTN